MKSAGWTPAMREKERGGPVKFLESRAAKGRVTRGGEAAGAGSGATRKVKERSGRKTECRRRLCIAATGGDAADGGVGGCKRHKREREREEPLSRHRRRRRRPV